MTTRKRNAVERECELAKFPATFEEILERLEEFVSLEGLTAKQIARIIEFGYVQKLYGENAMYAELKG